MPRNVSSKRQRSRGKRKVARFKDGPRAVLAKRTALERRATLSTRTNFVSHPRWAAHLKVDAPCVLELLLKPRVHVKSGYACWMAVVALVMALAGDAAAQIVRRMPGDHPNIQAALNAAPVAGWTIEVAPGTWVGNLNFLGKGVQLKSAGNWTNTTLQGNNTDTVIKLVNTPLGTLVEGFTITGGRGRQFPSSYGFDSYGGAIYCGVEGTTAIMRATIRGCRLTGNGLPVQPSGSYPYPGATFGGGYASGVDFYVTYSDVTGGMAGTGNINAAPNFVNSALGHWGLLSPSPCLNTGNPASPLDPDGTRADMGAWPMPGNALPCATTSTCLSFTNPAPLGWWGSFALHTPTPNAPIIVVADLVSVAHPIGNTGATTTPAHNGQTGYAEAYVLDPTSPNGLFRQSNLVAVTLQS